ncbi:hypothetical protein J3A83DRAFT_4455524 [Scleroderma citrinum]
MNLAATKFSVDRCTPRDKYARTQISFPRSVRTSVDDLVLDSPLSAFYVVGSEFRPRPPSQSFAAQMAEAMGSTGFSSPIDRHARRNYLDDQEQDILADRKDSPSSLPESPTVQAAFSVLDRTLRDTGFDISCLDTLDEQLLRSPTDCFTDICWASAVQEERVQYKQEEFLELDVDVVDMGVCMDTVHGRQTDAVEKYPKKSSGIPSTPPPRQRRPVVHPQPARTMAPLSSSLSSEDSGNLIGPDLDPRKRLVEVAAPSPPLYEKKMLTLPITPSTYEAHHINLALASDTPFSAPPQTIMMKTKTKDCPDVLAASGVRMLYSNPNDSVHYFPVPRDREKKERRDRTSSCSRESNRKKSQSRTQLQSSASSLHSSSSRTRSMSQSRSQHQTQGYAQKQTGSKIKKSNGGKKQKQHLQISSPTPVPSPFPNIVVDANMNANMPHAHTIPIAIPTFPASGYNTFHPSTPPCPLPDAYSAVHNLSPPDTPKSPNGKLRIISNAYSTLTGRRRVKSTV